MRLRQMEAQVRRLERERGKGERRVHYIVWWFGEPSNLPEEKDPDGIYYHYFMGDRPSDAEMDRIWGSIPMGTRSRSRQGRHHA